MSPVDRPTSVDPLKEISVLCMVTPNLRSRSFWLSKSISKATTSLNFVLEARPDRIGFWALQVGHQGQ